MPSDWFERVLPIESVLIIDDDPEDLRRIQNAFVPRRTHATSDVLQGLRFANSERPDLAVIDLWLGPQPGTETRPRAWKRDVFGIDIVCELRVEHPNMLIVLYSKSVSRAHWTAACEAGASGAVPKLIEPEKLVTIIEGGHLERPIIPDRPTLAWIEHDYTADRYLKNGRNATATASELGVSAPTLYKHLRSEVPKR